MKFKRKLIVLFTALLLSICAAIGTALPVSGDSYSALSDWSKSSSAGAGVSTTTYTDGGVHFSESATGGWDAQFYTAGYYNYDVPINNGIDMFLDIISGQVAIVLSGNGWVFNQQGSDTSVLNWNPTVSVVLTHYGDKIQLQRTDNWSTSQIAKQEGYNKLSFAISASGTEILFNDQSVFSFESTSSDYVNGTAKITVNRFSADTTLDTVVRSIPVAKNNSITFNNNGNTGFNVAYNGVEGATVKGMKYAIGDSTEYTEVDASKITATDSVASLDLQTSKEVFANVGNYKVILETAYGNIYYDVTVTSEKDATAMWITDASSIANLTALQDGGITYKNTPSAVGDGTRIYDITYNGEFSVNDDIIVDFTAPVNSGFASFVLTDGMGGNVLCEISIRNANANEDQTTFCYTIDFASWPYATKSESGYTRLTFKISESSTEIFANGNSLGTVAVGKSAFTSGKVGVKAGTCYFSWAPATEYSVRVGGAVAVNGSARYVQNSNKGVTFTYNAPFAPVTALKYGDNTISTENYTIEASKDVFGRVSFTASQIDSLFATAGDYTLTLETVMGNVDFVLSVVSVEQLELIKNSFVYDVYAGGDLKVPVYLNLDSLSSIKNGDNALIADTDYVFDANNEILTVKESYLKTLSSGNNTLTLVSNKNADGVAFVVKVEDHTPPTISGSASANFDKKSELQANVEFTFNVIENQFISLNGNGVAEGNYSYSQNVLTINKEFLATLSANATYEFVAEFTYGNVAVSVVVANTTAPSASIVSKNFNPSSPADVIFDIQLHESAFASFSGNEITEQDYAFKNGKLTVKKEYLATLDANTYTFVFASQVGTLNISVVVEEKEPPVANATSATFDVQNSQNVVFEIAMNNGVLIAFSGNGITSEDYTFENGVLTIKEQYIQTLVVGEYTFVFEADNGTINFEITVKNDVAPSFVSNSTVNKKYDRVDDKTADFDVDIYANLGKLISISGDEITENDYTYTATQTEGVNALTFKAEYLQTLGFGDNGLYTLSFDNGTLTLELRFDYSISTVDAYVTTGATVSDGGNGYAKISQTAVTSSFNWGYVADYTKALNVNEPITILYQFPQNPDKTWMYTLNISGDSHNYFWDTQKTIFVQFGVDSATFNQLRAGSYPSDEENHLTPANLTCNANGVNAVTIDVGEEDTKIYINGVLVNTSLRKLSDFTDGVAYLRFSSTTTYTDSTPYCEYMVLVNGGVKADATAKQFSIKAPEKVEWNLTFDNGHFIGVWLKGENDTLTELSNYRFLYTEFAKAGVLTFEKEDVLNDAILSNEGTYSLVVKSTGGEVNLTLNVSNKETLEISQNEFIFDKRKDDDILFDIWLNVDTFISVSGNDITEQDYTFENGVLTISNEYLKTLAYGEKTFKIISSNNSEGLEFIVQVVDYSDPELDNATADFDVLSPSEVVVKLNVKAGTFVSVTGNYITSNDYTYDVTTGNVTFVKDFFNDFEVGKYTFIINVDVFGTAYEIDFVINVKNSKTPVFESGESILNVTFDKNSPEDITFTVNANSGKFLALYGSYISASDYSFDATTGTIVIKQSYMATLSTNSKNTININFDNGKIDVVIEIIETEQSRGGCGSSVSTNVSGITVCAVAFIGVCVVLVKRRKTDNE